HRPDDRTPWPLWPQKYRLSYAMEEAREIGRGEQDFSVVTTHFSGADGKVTTQHLAQADASPPFAPVPGSERELKADLVLLATGFIHPEAEGLVADLGCELDGRGNIEAPTYQSSEAGIFVAGDARRGQSLIVWAINEGRRCARMVDKYFAEVPV
ncbi:MAG: FAD-dependent oxidoreductase, partial [Solirubrobacterales bacterium]|nr:FAD-dependent oxidoreductase [Solirubrobacterales bacterium]